MSEGKGAERDSKGWSIASLGEIEARGLVKLGRGKIISKRDIASNPGDYPIYSSAGQNGGEFGRYGSFLFDEELITWSVDGGGHLFHRERHRFSVTNVGGWLRILDLNSFDYRYLFFALTYLHSNITFDWSRKAHPSVIRLAYDAIPIPPLDEQKKIVEILEEQLSRLDAALVSVRTVRIKAGRFRRSLLNAAFTGALTGHESSAEILPEGWDSRLLKTCLEKLKSGKLVERGWSPQCLKHPAKGTWGVLKTTSVQMGEYLPEYNKELPKTLEPKVGLEVNDGDFLVTTTGPRNRCGVVCRVRNTPEKLIFSGKILRFRADENQVLASYLMYLLMSPNYQKALDRLKVGTSESSVSIGNQQILELEIPVASIDEQPKIVEILEEQFSRLDASLAVADAIEKKTSALRRSLLHAAFTGELTKEWREDAHV